MEYITVEGPMAAAKLRQVDYDHKHKGETRQTCNVRGCPERGMSLLGDGTWLCAWHDMAWRAFLENHRKATGKGVRLGKYGNWHIRFAEFTAWAEKDPKDRTFLPGQPLPNKRERYHRGIAL